MRNDPLLQALGRCVQLVRDDNYLAYCRRAGIYPLCYFTRMFEAWR